MPRKRADRAREAFTVEMPRVLPVERESAEVWWLDLDGRRLRLTNLDKIFWPHEGFTKGDLIDYYVNVAPWILPYLRERPLTMKRMPNGATGGFFYEKEAPSHTPAWMPRCPVESSGSDDGRWGPPKHEVIRFLMVEDAAGCAFMANLGCIEFHPLHSRCGTVGHPDYLFFDLDPFEPAGFDDVLAVARLVRVSCEQLGLRAYPKTSGATGMQIYVPLEPSFTYEEARGLVGAIGHLLRKVDPDRVTMEWQVSKRTGKIFVDHNMNRVGANIAAVFSLRPEPGAPVSTPLTWDEVERGDVRPGDFTIRTIWDRLKAWGEPGREPFHGLLADHQDIGGALEALGVERTGETGAAGAERGGGRATAARSTGPARGAVRSDTSAEVIARSKDPKLAEYLQKRTFGEEGTPEPASGEPSPGGNAFVIQKHDATRIHYDLRLERDGVMVSWAVPKGLPAVKGERHLAVHTEDHPMEYNAFEGTIPKGHYGAGAVRIWDQGTYDPVEWTDTKVSFRLHGERYRGEEYHLIKTKRGENDWLVFMASRSVEDPPTAPPAFAPMMAEPGGRPFDDPDWVFEPKLDGVRSLVYLGMNSVRLVSRTGKDQTERYPELGRIFERVTAENAVLDGEIVAFDAAGRPSFQRLQQRMNLASESEIDRMRREVPVQLFVFDVMWLDGQDLTKLPLTERRARLEEIVVPGKGIDLTLVVPEHGTALWESAKERGLEGVIAKRAASRYLPGRRSPDWRKVKVLNRDDFVILGWTPGQGGRASSFAALLLGAHVAGKLRWVGQVGTGFSDRTLKGLMAKLTELETDRPAVDEDPELARVPGARWVRPELIASVEYLQVTEGGRKLRAPSFKGLRDDVLPEDCVLVAPDDA
jgi:bifunctional non-homologous end joining protein LigD